MAPTGDAPVLEAVRAALDVTFLGQDLDIEKIELVGESESGMDVLADVAIRPSPTRTRRPNTRFITRQTVALFLRKGIDLPNASIAPNKGMLATLARGASRLTGIPTIELPEDPDFTREFAVLTFEPRRTAALLRPEVRAALRSEPGLTVVLGPGRVAAYEHGVLQPEEHRTAFLTRARRLAEVILRAADFLGTIPVSAREEVGTVLQSTGGSLVGLVLGPIVHKSDVDALLAQPPPRQLPASIRRKAHAGSGFFMALGTVLTVIAIPSTIAAFAIRGAPRMPWFAPLLFLLPAFLGLLCLASTAYYRRRKRHLLEYGRCEEATVISVEATNWYVNNERVHRVTFETTSGPLTIRTGPREAALARSLQQTRTRTRLLVDPGNPRRAVWIDSWPVENYADL